MRLVTDKAEYYYDAITEGLGFRRLDFWLWDNRAKIYIYNDAAISEFDQAWQKDFKK